ncbi:MAG: hypothetical protein BMS9Abin07_1072 [Acidimicrobiia bacterium]|nr:MAG: hypothetical protein BMS9Abin07_1072 [Acidimicrobiia bacterium]
MTLFTINVADLVGRDAPPRSVHIEAAVDWGVALSKIQPEPPLVADLTLSHLPSGVLVRGTLEFLVEHTCRRCLTVYRDEADHHVTGLFEVDPDEEAYPIDGVEIDLEPFLRDEALLALPLLPECPDGCVTVVTTPETGLNTDLPDAASEVDSPFAALRDLLPPGE